MAEEGGAGFGHDVEEPRGLKLADRLRRGNEVQAALGLVVQVRDVALEVRQQQQRVARRRLLVRDVCNASVSAKVSMFRFWSI